MEKSRDTSTVCISWIGLPEKAMAELSFRHVRRSQGHPHPSHPNLKPLNPIYTSSTKCEICTFGFSNKGIRTDDVQRGHA